MRLATLATGDMVFPNGRILEPDQWSKSGSFHLSSPAKDLPRSDKQTVLEMNDQPSPSGLELKSQDLPKVILTSEQERKLWQKIDVRLLPIISLMYLLSFMDRGGYFTNVCSSECGCPYYPQEISVSSCELHVESYLFYIGNAKIEGLMTQLHLTGNRFNVALVRHITNQKFGCWNATLDNVFHCMLLHCVLGTDATNICSHIPSSSFLQSGENRFLCALEQLITLYSLFFQIVRPSM